MDPNETKHLSFMQGDILSITDKAKSEFLSASKWGKFLSLFGILTSLILVCTIVYTVVESETSFGGPFDIFLTFCAIVILSFFIFPPIFHWSFSTKLSKSIDSNNEEEFANAIGDLKLFFKFIGIWIIVLLTVFVLTIAAGTLGLIT